MTRPCRRFASLAILVLLGGCAAPTPTSPPPSGRGDYAVVGQDPVLAHDDEIGFLLSGALIASDGELHLYPVAFATDAGEPPRVLHLVSADGGRTWDGDRSAPTLLGGAGIGLNEIGPIPSSGIVSSDGRWLLYGGGRLEGSDRPVIWQAEAPGPTGPWRLAPDPVLELSADGWDDQIVDHPSVIETDDGFLMAYGGASGSHPNRNRIGLARSADGRTWTRIASTLTGADDTDALGPHACGIEARSMFEPHLVPDAPGIGLWWGAMVEGTDRMVIGMATTHDGGSWSCAADGPVIEPEDLPGTLGLHSFVVTAAGGAPLVLVEALLAEAVGSDLWLLRPGGESD